MPRTLEKSLETAGKWNINFLNLIFTTLSFCVVFFGVLMQIMEPKLPTAVKQLLRYGKHCHKGEQVQLLSRLEVPKSWFSHFYTFGAIWSLWSMYLGVQVLLLHYPVPEYAAACLDSMAGGKQNRKVTTDTTTGAVALTLVCLQYVRRFYESNFVQIYSRKSRMSIFHYFVGYLYFFAMILVLLAGTEGFVEGSPPSTFSLMRISCLQYFGIILFLFSWWHQHQSILILSNLRRDVTTGKVITEKHLFPQGGYFELVSSPHMFFEILMYVSLLGLLAQSVTWWLVVAFVF